MKKNSMLHHIILAVFVLFALFVSVSKVEASSCSSNGTGGGNFNVAATWTSCNSTTPQTTDSITINSGDTVTLVASTNVVGVTINSGGILAANTRALTNTDGYTNNGSHTGTTSTMTLSGPSGAIITGTGSYTPTGIVTISTGDKTVASGSNLSFDKITVTGVTLTNNSTAGLTVRTALAGTGTLTQGSSSVLNLGGTTTVSTLDASVNSNAVHYTSTTAGQTIKAATYYNLFIEKSGQTATGNGTWNVGGALSVTTGSTLQLSSSTLTVTGISDIHGTLSDTNNSGSATFGGLVTVYSDGAWGGNVGEACDFNFKNGFSFSGTSFVTGSGIYTFLTNNQSITGSQSISVNNLVVTGIQLTNSSTATVTVSTALSGTGELIAGANTNLKIGGIATITTITAGASGNTVDYNSSSAQVLNPATYYNLTLSNKIENGAYLDVDSSGTVTAGDIRLFIGHPSYAGFGYSAGSTISGGDTDIGTVMVLPTGTHNLKKTGTNSTQFVSGTDGAYIDTDASATVTAGDIRIVIGSAASSGLGFNVGSTVASGNSDLGTAIVLPTGANNLKKTGVASTDGSASFTFVYSYTDSVTLSANATVNASLNLGAVLLSTSTNKIILGTGATVSRTSGYVYGTIEKNFNSSSSFTFDIGDASNYTPIDLTLAGVSGSGSIDGSVTNTDHTDIASSGIDSTKSVNRYFTLVNNALSFTSYSPVFHFVSGDVDSGATVSAMIIGKKSSGVWSILTSTCASTSCNATGLTSMSDFQIGVTAAAPTPTPTQTTTSSSSSTSSSTSSSDSSSPPLTSSDLPTAIQNTTISPISSLITQATEETTALFDILSSPLLLKSGSGTIIPVVGGIFLIGSSGGFVFILARRRKKHMQMRQNRVLRIEKA